ncbi:SUMF1/EgtB/PvdO family nonheme iron enzyme [Bacteroidota bacterium]
MKYRIKLPVILIGVVFLASCAGGGNPNFSSTTGWDYNNPDNGGFEVVLDYEQQTGPGLVLIEGGTFVMGNTQDEVMSVYNSFPTRVTVASFYMDETEIKNVDYREYLHWLKRVYVDYPEVHRDALPDTLVWRSPLGFNEPYAETYFRHPAYNYYPVVGVSWVQASNYCLWRTDRVNEQLLINEGILLPNPNQVNEENFNSDAYLAGQYEGLVGRNLPSLDPNQEERRVRFEDGILLPKYRLPTEAEWEYAALGLIGNTYDERIYGRKMFPWNGHNVRNSQGKAMGQMMANYKRGRGDMMGVAGALNDNASITAPVRSYWPNDYGLYCMAGNVNEWVLDVYRPLSFQDLEDFRPFRGNVFETLLKDEEGRIVQKDSLGRLRYREVTEEESQDRMNYQKSYYKNYKDGDKSSSLTYSNDMDIDERGSGRMYGNDPTTGEMITRVNDRTRVYKGGSWRDRSFWLNPGTRRYLHEEKSTDDIGFRCAMNRVGSPGGF